MPTMTVVVVVQNKTKDFSVRVILRMCNINMHNKGEEAIRAVT